MKSKESFKSELEVKIPEYTYHFEKLDKTDTIPIEYIKNDEVSRRLMETKGLNFELVPNDYREDNYKIGITQHLATLVLNLKKDKLKAFKKKLLSLLKEPKKASKITESQIEEQFNFLLYRINNFNPDNFLQRYRVGSRKQVIDFYAKMADLVLDKSNAIEEAETIIKIKIGSKSESKYKEFKLPLSPKGNGHFLEAFSLFLYSYYHNNPTCRSVYAYTDELILEKHKTISKKKNYLKQDVIDDARLSLHITVLNIIKDFPQFPPSKRPNSILTEDQGRFIVQFLHLMGYNNKYRRIELDDPLNLNQDTKTLRDELRALLNNLENTSNTAL